MCWKIQEPYITLTMTEIITDPREILRVLLNEADIDLDDTITSISDIEKYFRALRFIDKKREKLKRDEAEIINDTKIFYQGKRDQLDKSEQWLRGEITGYVLANGESVSSPNGTAFKKTTTRVKWLVDDDELVTYALNENIPDAVKTEYTPRRTVIKEWIGDGHSRVLQKEKVTNVQINLKKGD